jgi:steroid delta-isomerase-like uncharacterized protein
MSVEENKALIKKWGEEWNALAGDVTKMRALAEKYFGRGWVHHGLLKGDQTAEQRMQDVLAAMPALPDLAYALEDIVAEGDKVVARYTARGTHKGTFLGIPATGKQLTYKGVEIFRIAGGKIVETWDFPDGLGLMTQLGVGPGAGPKK